MSQKNFIISVITFLIIFTSLLIYINKDSKLETIYTGVVVDKHYVAPTSGYKSSTDEVYSIFIKEKISNKVIKVNVNIPTYYSCNKGKVVSFSLSNRQMYDLGNTKDPNKNLYNK